MHILTIVLATVVWLGGATALLAQSPLGEVAQREQERRKAIKSESRVYTNRDLPNVPPPSNAPGGSVPAQALPAEPVSGSAADADAAAAAAESAEPEEASKDRTYWNDRMTALRETLARNQTYAEALQSRINALTTDFVNRDDPLQRAAIAADRDRATTELERLRKQLVADEKAIADLETEARRAGVPPGWLR
jgi:hypothetical protein